MNQTKPKVFGIGFHKTGTKSLAGALRKLGYRVTGPNFVRRPDVGQTAALYCHELIARFDAFQDNPWPMLYRHVDRTYPGSRFILTLRDEARWLESATRHFGSEQTPMRRWIYGVGAPLGNEQIYLERYRRHIEEVRAYFHGRPNDLLEIDITAGDGWDALCGFLDKPVPKHLSFPHRNRASDRASDPTEHMKAPHINKTKKEEIMDHSTTPTLQASDFSIVFVCHGGAIETKACLLAASLRVQLGDGVPLVAAVPVECSPVSAEGIAFLDEIGVRREPIHSPFGEDYLIGNKLTALGVPVTTRRTIFLDSDILCLRPFDAEELPPGDVLVKPADAYTWGASDDVWKSVYTKCGAPLPQRRVLTSFSNEFCWPYFNAGVIMACDAPRLSRTWLECCRRLYDDLEVPSKFPWLDQICLPVAIHREQREYTLLNERWNHPGQLKSVRDDVIFCHYHSGEIIRQEPALNRQVIDLAEKYPRLKGILQRLPEFRFLLNGYIIQGPQGRTTTDTSAIRSDHGGTNLVITGLPRTGTSLLCRLLHLIDDTVVVNEPFQIFKSLKLAPQPHGVPLFYRALRGAIMNGQAIPNKVDEQGQVIDDTARRDVRSMYRPEISHPGFTLGTKNTLGYLMRLPDIHRVMPEARVVVCIRDPMATLRSWKGSFPHLRDADVDQFPVSLAHANVLDPSLVTGLKRIRNTTDPMLRRALTWTMLTQWLDRIRNDEIIVLRYEDLVADPVAGVESVLGRALTETERGRIEGVIRPATRREVLPPLERQIVHDICWPAASLFGYSPHEGEPVARSTQREMSADRGRLVGPPMLANQKRAFQIQFLQDQGLRPTDKLLDLGCGVLRGGIPLIDFLNTGHYYGIEISSERLAEGRNELRENQLEHKQPELFGDYEALLDANPRFDVIWSYQVVIHMSDEIARNAIAKIAPLLKPTGHFFITTILGDEATGAWMEYPCRTRPFEFFKQIAENNGLDVEQVPYDHPMLNNMMLKFTPKAKIQAAAI